MEAHIATLVEQARSLAVYWHADQRYGDLPYIVHLDAVAQCLAELGAPAWQIAAAYLHDLLEDTACPEEVIESTFGAEVLRWVRAVSGRGANRKEKLAHILRMLANCPEAALLKLADRYANVSAAILNGETGLLQMYRKEQPHYAKLFAQANAGLAAKLERLLDPSAISCAG